ncbi:MAG TPA: arsenic resistance N-acetyltransferase ArsN2 [Steroidobacteraceae bacterium]|nr:arsenic resistance N-acetyltransferase ArsN2 [Steroidobacteraceae bacterium]
MVKPRIREATLRDAGDIRSLLERNGLPTRDLVSSRPEFIVACAGARIIGAGALERFGATALLRSIVVASEARSAGLGGLIVRELERRARAAGVLEVILLTETAESFFRRQNYHTIGRSGVPAAIQASEEFRSLCPASAHCLSKELTDPGEPEVGRG